MWLYQGRLTRVNGAGSYDATECFWVPAILEYDVQLDDKGQVTILQDPASAGDVVSIANNTITASSDNSYPSEYIELMTYFTYYLGASVSSNASAWPPEPGATGDFGWSVDSTTFNAQANEN